MVYKECAGSRVEEYNAGVAFELCMLGCVAALLAVFLLDTKVCSLNQSLHAEPLSKAQRNAACKLWWQSPLRSLVEGGGQ